MPCIFALSKTGIKNVHIYKTHAIVHFAKKINYRASLNSKLS